MRKNWFVRSLSMLLTVLILASGIVVFTNNNTVFADPLDGWVQSNGNWYYYIWGTLQTDGWIFIQDEYGNAWYRFDSNGVLVEDDKAFTGWNWIDFGWYYYETPGVRSTGWKKIDGDWYYFSVYDGWSYNNGEAYIDDDLYYFAANGMMLTGWVESEYTGVTLYLKEDGRAVTSGSYKIDGKKYFFGEVYSGPAYEFWSGVGLLSDAWVLVGEDEWHYYGEDNCEVKDGVGFSSDGKAYYLDSTGKIATGQSGWKLVDSDWYYVYEDGSICLGWLWDNGHWYYMDPETGKMATGWACDNGTWYYMNSSGAMQTGWIKDNGLWYYLMPSGAMKTGWLWDNGMWYYLNKTGDMKTGWICDNGTWYYLSPSGDMKTGWVKVNDIWYYLTPGSGAMKTGWIMDGGVWYYLDASGAMAADTWIGNYYVDASGAWTKTK